MANEEHVKVTIELSKSEFLELKETASELNYNARDYVRSLVRFRHIKTKAQIRDEKIEQGVSCQGRKTA